MNSLPKTVTRQRRGCDLNPGTSAPESSTLTTRLPSHQVQFTFALFLNSQHHSEQFGHLVTKSCCKLQQSYTVFGCCFLVDFCLGLCYISDNIEHVSAEPHFIRVLITFVSAVTGKVFWPPLVTPLMSLRRTYILLNFQNASGQGGFETLHRFPFICHQTLRLPIAVRYI